MLIRVKVKTGARREGLLRVAEGKYEISVKEKPEHNAANARILAMLSLEFMVPAKSIRFVSGQRSPSKIFELK